MGQIPIAMRRSADQQIHSLELACYHAVHDYPGQVKAVAAVFGWRASTLQNKLNPTQSTHKLTAHEAQQILDLTRDGRIVDALCAPMGITWLEQAKIDAPAGDLSMLERSNDLLMASTALINEIVSALDDGVIDKDEWQRIKKRAYELQQSSSGVTETARQFQETGSE